MWKGSAASFSVPTWQRFSYNETKKNMFTVKLALSSAVQVALVQEKNMWWNKSRFFFSPKYLNTWYIYTPLLYIYLNMLCCAYMFVLRLGKGAQSILNMMDHKMINYTPLSTCQGSILWCRTQYIIGYNILESCFSIWIWNMAVHLLLDELALA